MKDRFVRGRQYEIFIGIKDKDIYREIISVEDFRRILTELCVQKQIGFSLLTQFGGYTHGKGYTTETSLRVVLIGIDDEAEVRRIADCLKQRINTDAALITCSEIEYCFMA